jgi:hypothetical protein
LIRGSRSESERNIYGSTTLIIGIDGFVYRLFEVGGGKGDVMVGVSVDVWQGFRILCAHYNLVKKSLHIKATPETRRNEYDMMDGLSSIL